MSIVLMYHALYKSDDTALDTALIDTEDLPYAVSVDDFTRQMELLKDYSVGLWSNTELPDIIITFDDGHISNHDLALPVLKQFGFDAYFFISSDFIGKRRGFCEPVHINNMAKAGMVIGAHGQTHRFFDDLTAEQAQAELQTCQQVLSTIIDERVSSISFPGGRYNSDTLKQCKQADLELTFGSEFGVVSKAAQGGQAVINRIAIRRNTSLTEFKRIIKQDKKYYVTQTAKHRCKRMLKRLIGNQLYHGLYKLLSKR